MITHAQKPDFVFRRNGRFHLNRRGRQFSRLMAAEVCASAVVMLDTPCPEATHSIRQFLLHFPSCESPCAITFQMDSTLLHDYTNLCHILRFRSVLTNNMQRQSKQLAYMDIVSIIIIIIIIIIIEFLTSQL